MLNLTRRQPKLIGVIKVGGGVKELIQRWKSNLSCSFDFLLMLWFDVTLWSESSGTEKLINSICNIYPTLFVKAE